MASSKEPEVRFEVNFGKDDWKILPQQCQAKIRAAISASDTSVSVEYRDQKATLDFTKMSLVHSDGNVKYVRCAVADLSGCFYVWSYKDDNNVWRSYPVRECGILEQAFDEGEHLKKLEIAGKNYTIQFRRWHQESADTGYRRKISRIKSNAVDLGAKPEPSDSKESKESSAKSTKSAASSAAQVTKSMLTTVKGRPPVDPEAVNVLPSNMRCHIYVDDSTGDVYDVLLNQTNVAQNNNKYYIIQLIEADGAKQFWTWTRWGRVGYKGQNNLDSCGSDLNEARDLFESKFQQKTLNNWSDRKKFVKRSGKYDLIERDFGADREEEDTENEQEQGGVKRKGSVESRDQASKKAKTEPENKVPSKLDIRLQHLLEMICDIRDMEEVVVSMNYDVQKAPLGKLTTAQLKAGYTALQKIAAIIESKDSEEPRQISSSRKAPSSRLSSSAMHGLVEACNEFYTRVPHCFGMRQPPLILTHGELKSKLELLETLGDIEIAIHSMKEEKALTSPEHPLDKHYRNLHCTMVPVEPGSDEYSLINRYLHETHGLTHGTYKMEMVEVFAVSREDEIAGFRNDVGNNMLLWHGSRLTNYYGILSQGLRIAPPEAPVTGYMFGKGVYFADCSSKSANYCQTSALRNVGFLLLCKVALGKQNELLAADYKADKLPKGFDSVKGLGKWIPDSAHFETLADGTVVPVGRMVTNPDKNSPRFSLLYNEFVVYDTHQIAMKYICKVKFNFNI